MTPGIGFHELRQACEISALREDLERLAQETGILRDGVETAVEQVRARFAALSAEELTDASVMASLLQFAVTTLLDIREQARRINTQTGPVADDDRPSWLGAAEAPRVRPAAAPPGPRPKLQPVEEPDPVPPPPAEPAPRPAPAAFDPPLPRKSAPPKPPPVEPVDSLLSREPPPVVRRPADISPAISPPSAAASWLTSNDTPPPPSRASVARATPPAPPPPGGIDWLGPAGR